MYLHPNRKEVILMTEIIEGELEETMTPLPKNQPKEESKAQTISFPDAIKEIIKGKKVSRISWANTDYCLLREGWLTIWTKGAFHTWSVSDGDMEGQDWVVIGGTN